MAGFGDVLRGLGSVLNPQVNQEVEADYARKQAQQQALQQFALGQLVKGVESGAIAPERLPAPLQGIVGVSPEAQARMEALKNEKGYREALAGLGENPSEDQIAQTAVKFGKPEVAAAYAKAREDRLARIQTAADNLEMRRQALEQQKTLALERAADQRQRDQINADFRAQSLALQGQIAASNAEMKRLGLNIQQQGLDMRRDALENKVPKAMPAAAAKGLIDNEQNLRRAKQALALIEGKDVGEMKGDANATGLKGYLPDAILQRVDPKGIDARAAFADLGSLVIHDRSGAAVTAAEFPRLQPFIPSPKDDPETVKKKLRRFVQVYEETNNNMREFYKDSGYNVPDSKASTVAPAAPVSDMPPPGAVRRKN